MSEMSLANRLEEVIARGRAYIERRPRPEPPFALMVGWSANYDRLLRGVFEEQSPVEAILPTALNVGRIFVVGKGGSGKSVALLRLMERALGDSVATVFIDLRQWSAPAYESWGELATSSVSDRLNFLAEHFGHPSVSALELDALPRTIRKLLLVDGLSEIKAHIAADVIGVLDEYVREAVQTSVVVTDRITRRELRDPSRWAFARLLPLSEKEISEQIERRENGHRYETLSEPVRELLKTPYFLNGYLQDPATLGSSSSRLQSYFKAHAGIYESSLGELTRAAFELYIENGTRSFRLESLERRVGHDIVASLLAAGILRLDGDFAYFSHHLLHDYLAARYVAVDDRTWTADTFQSITFGANSFDTLVFALEQIPSIDAGDLFARLVFDWNPYAVAYAISEAATQDRHVSEAMQFVLLAMLAERQFDVIAASALRAADALAVFPSDDANAFMRAASVRDVIGIVSNRTYEAPWFHEWRELFAERSSGSVEGHAVKLIGERDSIFGWTAANVIKRLRLDERTVREVRGYAASGSSPIRWRAAHALGAFPDDESVSVLFRLLNDPDAWVRYGSIRSLVEAAARGSAELRSGVFRKVTELVAAKRLDGKTLREFERAIFLARSQTPRDWISAVSPVLECLFDSAESLNDHDHWAEVAVRLKAWMSA
jgi:hypothetical protein